MKIKIHSSSITVRATRRGNISGRTVYADEVNVDEIAGWFEAGAVGTLVTRTRIEGENTGVIGVDLGSPDGIPGNMDSTELATIGWRGTSYGVSVDALGVVRITAIQTLARGYGYRIAFERVAS